MSELPLYLAYPLTSSLLFTVGALLIKRATANGVSAWTLTLTANLCAAGVFSLFWPLGGQMAPLGMLWQPAVIAILYICGQVFLLSALTVGDVSVVAPVAGVKVLGVASLTYVFTETPPSNAVWLAAVLATVGIGLINFAMPKSGRRSVMITVALSVAAAASFALFDVCLQTWANNWGIGRLPPIMYWMVGLFSLVFLPFADTLSDLREKPWKSVLAGSAFSALQATCLVYSISIYQDAPRINVVYSLRGLWGVALAWFAAWAFADWVGGDEGSLSPRTMVARMLGATLLVGAVVITILADR